MKPKLTKAQKDEREALVDELGAAEASLAALDGTAQRARELRAVVESWCETAKPAESVSFAGKRFAVICGPRKNERTVDTAGLRDFLGDGFYEIATVGLGAIDRAAQRLPHVLNFVKSDRTGKRTLTVSPKAA